jgi:methylglutamate dehydrogenase subunit B
LSLKIPCPNCGLRPQEEFKFGGEVLAPDLGDTATEFARVFLKSNVTGPQRERWYHLFGCRRWLTITRDTSTDRVIG